MVLTMAIDNFYSSHHIIAICVSVLIFAKKGIAEVIVATVDKRADHKDNAGYLKTMRELLVTVSASVLKINEIMIITIMVVSILAIIIKSRHKR